MRKLDTNWLTNNLIDFEYKKYQLLDYFQTIDRFYNRFYIFPFIDDINTHYKSIKLIQNNINLLDSINKEALFNDIDKTISWEPKHKKDHFILEIENVLNFCIPKFQMFIKNGVKIKEKIKSDLKLEPVGLINQCKNFEYLLIKKNDNLLLYDHNFELKSTIPLTISYSEIKSNLDEKENRIVNL